MKVYFIVDLTGCVRCDGWRALVRKVFSSRELAEKYLEKYYRSQGRRFVPTIEVIEVEEKEV